MVGKTRFFTYPHSSNDSDSSAAVSKLMFSCKRWQMAVISFESEDVETILLNVHTHRCCIVLYMGDVPSFESVRKPKVSQSNTAKIYFINTSRLWPVISPYSL